MPCRPLRLPRRLPRRLRAPARVPARLLLASLAASLALAAAATRPAPDAAVAQGPPGQLLFGHDNGRSAIVQISTATGRAKWIGATGYDSGASGMATAFGPVEGPGGRRFAAGTFFGIIGDNRDGQDYVVVVDPSTGQAEKLVRTRERLSGRGIAFGGDGGTLYAISYDRLVRVDTRDGRVTEVGPVADAIGRRYSGSSLEWDPDSGELVALLDAEMDGRSFAARIHPDTAEVSLIAPLDLQVCTIIRAPNPVPGPGPDWPEGTWFTIDLDRGELVVLDMDTTGRKAAIGARLGSLGGEVGGSLCGTAFTLPQAPPTPTPGPTATPSPAPTRPPAGPGCVCDVTLRKVPPAVRDDALANPDKVTGWNQLLDPNKPGAPPWPAPGHDAPPNPRRTCLDVQNRAIGFHPLFNGVVYRAGCY